MKLYLVRHGESEGNAQKLFYGWADYPLTDLGREQARTLCGRMKEVEIARCYASPLSRAFETAQLVLAGRDLEIEVDARLKEQHMGDLEGVPFMDMLEKHPEEIGAMLDKWSDITPPGGESFVDLTERVRPALDEIIASGEDSIIVAHTGTLAAVMSLALRFPHGATDSIWFDHGRWSCIELGARPRLMYFNR